MGLSLGHARESGTVNDLEKLFEFSTVGQASQLIAEPLILFFYIRQIFLWRKSPAVACSKPCMQSFIATRRPFAASLEDL
jgi:hypothetical protein